MRPRWSFCPRGGVAPGPIDNILKKNGTCLYHLCYETPDLDKAVGTLRKQGYLPVSVRKRSLIGGRDVIFLYHPDSVMIELVEAGAPDEDKDS